MTEQLELDDQPKPTRKEGAFEDLIADIFREGEVKSIEMEAS